MGLPHQGNEMDGWGLWKRDEKEGWRFQKTFSRMQKITTWEKTQKGEGTERYEAWSQKACSQYVQNGPVILAFCWESSETQL